MRMILLLVSGLILTRCDNAVKRDTRVTAAEEFERNKPLLFPAGGLYLDSVSVNATGLPRNLEYSTSGNFTPWPAENLVVGESTSLTVRDSKRPELATQESYTIVHEFPQPTLYPPPGEYSGAQMVALLGLPRNVAAEINTPTGFIAYSGESGILVSQSKTLEIRLCSATRCSPPQFFTYIINPAVPLVERPLTAAELTAFNDDAKGRYSQTLPAGLAALLDEAKLRVIGNATLIANAALRQRFLAQDNTLAAENLCTTISRYLYTKARRLALGVTEPQFPDFADYYITHIARGNITTDTLGRNFDWVLNGPALVTPYLPHAALAAFEFARATTYPTDYSLLDALATVAPGITLLRDGPTAGANTHTFFAIKIGADYTMIDTYFSLFSGSPLRGWSGFSGYYAYRFGPQGSRFLHYVYGY